MAHITATIHASTPEQVLDLTGCLHDGEFDHQEIRVDCDGAVTIPFVQRPLDGLGLPAPELVGHAARGGQVYREPYYRGAIVVRQARRLGIATRHRDGDGQISRLRFDPARSAVRLEASIGPDVLVEVEAIDVTLRMTDEVAFVMRRTVRGSSETSVTWRD